MLRDADELIAPAVEATISACQLQDADAALAKLARRYAAAIDRAAELAADADTVSDRLDPGDATGRQQLTLLAAKVEDQAVLASLGPRLLAALTALGATPAARARRRSGGGDRAAPSRLQALREARP